MTPGKELSVAQASRHFWCQSLQNDKSILPFLIEKTLFQSLLTLLCILSARISGILMPQRDIANAPAAPEMRTLRATQITVAIHAIHQQKRLAPLSQIWGTTRSQNRSRVFQTIMYILKESISMELVESDV